MNLVLVGWLVLCLESASATQCLSCAPMPIKVPCVTTKTCPSGQECFANYVLKTDGTVMYEFGCKDTQTCPRQIGTDLIGKRASGDTELCYRCCHGDMCNQGNLCTATTSPVNPCSPSPCMRGACYIGNGNNPTFFCLCPSAFTGMHCETVITTTTARTTPIQTKPTTIPTTPANPCSPSPCVRGSCYIGSGNNPTFFCLCPTSFTGIHCETIITMTTTTPIQTTTTATTTYKCVYFDGRMFNQGDKWMDGCSVECECFYAAYNTFRCNDKCPVFSGLPSICVLITDPANTCCKKPQCTLTSGSTLSPLIGNATAPPNSLQILPVGTHNLTSGFGRPDTSVPGYRDKCAYKGVVYSQGQSWDDGCDYVCTCENALQGMYRCTSKCPQYPTLPSYCKMVKIPGQCCPSLTCDIPGYGTYNPVPQLVPTPRPPGATSDPHLISATNPPLTGGTNSNQCMYKNVLYNEGAIWDDGCNYRCECQDGRTGYYVCNPLCPVYNNLPSNQCYLVKADSQCCSTPMCYDPNTGKVVNPMSSQSVFPVVGTYSGGFTGFRPNTQPGGNFGNGVACVYKGKVYHKGDTWDDGCDFSCTCVDETTGTYTCDAICPTYTNIPPVCRLVDQPAGICCKKLMCNPISVTGTIPPGTTILPLNTTPNKDPNCYDRINNCNAYGHVACTQYPDWADRNCALYCSKCTPMYTTAPTPCGDKLPDCKDFGSQSCSGIYEPWARDKCAQFCGYCSSTSADNRHLRNVTS